ncbi:hypothetical protein C922_05756 [Plasmodium inui San Antonio 1]|uniref:Uncharacterized protein n=1 Tax=Plasmodium inui San Antonio 1 TaxID=1237626 RepID=W6ZSH9_9APIC|nr:hypothetical protein C922_05756 [Plasmodium inui San Antonio 1]EUD63862.1 hypothetical protein C922_05756 [Plasmodium inui San Antonio 1]
MMPQCQGTGPHKSYGRNPGDIDKAKRNEPKTAPTADLKAASPETRMRDINRERRTKATVGGVDTLQGSRDKREIRICRVEAEGAVEKGRTRVRAGGQGQTRWIRRNRTQPLEHDKARSESINLSVRGKEEGSEEKGMTARFSIRPEQRVRRQRPKSKNQRCGEGYRSGDFYVGILELNKDYEKMSKSEKEIKWNDRIRGTTPHASSCRQDSEERFCFWLNPPDQTSGRPAAGLQTWMDRFGVTGAEYQDQAGGFRGGVIESEQGKQNMTWQDILDSVIRFSTSTATDRASNNSEEEELTLAERRVWKALLGGNATVQCQNNGVCQKTLYFIGCIIYWLWKDNADLIDKDNKAWAKCQSIRRGIFPERDNHLFTTKEGWKLIQRGKRTCQAGNNFMTCEMEGLGLVMSIYEAINSLCPKCPLSGMNEFLNMIQTPGPTQDIFCRKRAGKPPLCQIGQAKEDDSVKLKTGDEDQEVTLPPVQEKLTSNTPRADETEAPAGRRHPISNTDSAVESSQERLRQDKDDRGTQGHETQKTMEPQIEMDNVQDKGTGGNSSTQSQEEAGRSTIETASSGLRTKHHDQTPTTEDKLAKDPGSSRQQINPEVMTSEAGQGADPESSVKTEEATTGAGGEIVGGVVGVSLMLVASSYGLYRIYGRRRVKYRTKNGGARRNIVQYGRVTTERTEG